jgi:hypothetical protein
MTGRNAAAQVVTHTANPSPKEICSQAVARLERLLEQKPALRLDEIDKAERLAVRLRDCLIERMRAGDVATRSRTHPALKRTNMAVSRIVGVEYPAAGVQEKPLQEARGALREVLDRDRL